MDDDFDNDVDLADDNLDEPLGDLGDLGAGDAALEAETEFESELGGSRSSGGARALTTTREPDSARAAAKPSAKKAAKKKAAKKKAAKKKAAPKKKAKAAAKKTRPKSKPARKAGRKK